MADKNPIASEPDEFKPGPDPERLKVEGDWEEAVKKAMRKKNPPRGWAKPEKRAKDGHER